MFPYEVLHKITVPSLGLFQSSVGTNGFRDQHQDGLTRWFWPFTGFIDCKNNKV